MVALRSGEVDGFIAKPAAARPVALVFGPDSGLVSERVLALVRACVDDLDDPFALVRLDGDAVAADPARLVDEAGTIPLFGGQRAIWIKAAGRDFTAAVETLIESKLSDYRVVIEAGDLRRGTALRTLCERSSKIAAIACYPDSDRELSRLIDEEMGAANLTITPEARSALLPLLGGDRRASRNELRKLTLYAAGKERIELDDVIAIVADASALALDNVVDAVFAGRAHEVESSFWRARQAGIAPGRIVTAAIFQVGQLHRARLAVEAGASLAEAADLITSKAQFRRRGAVETALKSWTASRLATAMQQLAEASLEARRLTGPSAELSDPVVSRTLLMLAQAARRKE